MKRKKLLAALLAAAMAFSLLPVPALAAPDPDTVEALDSRVVLDLARKDVVRLTDRINVRAQFWEPGQKDGVSTRTLSEPSDRQDISVCRLPLGVTLAAGPRNPWTKYIMVLSDPDGDGIFVQRLEQDNWDADEEFQGMEIVPAGQTGTLTETDTVSYYGLFDWNRGLNWFESGRDERAQSGYRTLTTDYLVELFGANTLLMLEDEGSQEYAYFLLTGEARPVDMPRLSLEDGEIFLTREGGFLVSKWALEAVDAAYREGLVPAALEDAHGFDFQGQITRGEFAALSVYLYCAMAGLDHFEYPENNPFVDVRSSDPNYKAILSAHRMGFVKGTSTAKKTFEPDTLVTRQDAAVMLARVYEKLGGRIPSTSTTDFIDNVQIAGYARGAVAFMSGKGIINGVGGNRFNPTGYASVEQALKIALEMLNRLDVPA